MTGPSLTETFPWLIEHEGRSARAMVRIHGPGDEVTDLDMWSEGGVIVTAPHVVPDGFYD